ncbi:MAG: fibronectin type III domain-containing protein [Longimicrobiales bacterium]
MRATPLAVLVLSTMVACTTTDPVVIIGDPDAPQDVQVSYFNGGVDVTWELGPSWNGEPFRVYGKRRSDSDFFLIAEVTSCAANLCTYRDINVSPEVTYEYYVAAVDDGGFEATSGVVEVFVPDPIPPAVPTNLGAVALDNATYLFWDDSPASEGDFSAYRVYLADPDGDFLLGETDSPGFVDLLGVNGTTFEYFTTSVDDQGHESAGSGLVESTPRPDFTGELVHVYQDAPGTAGFRFQESDDLEAVLSGDDPSRHFRLEADTEGLWLVAGPGAEIFPAGQLTTALKCGVAADPGCTSWELAPLSGYGTADVPVDAEFTYMFQVPGDNGTNFGAVRVSLIGVDQGGNQLMVFDWAYQTQPGNPNLSVATSTMTR